MVIEKEFIEFMAAAYPMAAKESRQYKTSRLVFYSGAFTLVTTKKAGETVKDLDAVVTDLKTAIALATELTKKGISPEETLADYAEHHLQTES